MTDGSNDGTKPPPVEDLAATVRRMRRQQEAISAASLSDAFVAGDVDRLACEVTELAARTLGVERANVWLFNEAATQMRCIDLFEATAGRHSSGGVLTESEYGNEFAHLKKSRFVDADDPLTDPRTTGYVAGYLTPLRITSMLDAVIEVSGHCLGVLCLEHVDQAHHWERDEVAFACQLADKIALSLLNRARRDARETLQASEERFAGAFEYAPIGVALVSPDGRFMKVNRALCKLTGYTESALLALNFQDITHPEDLAVDLENLRQLSEGAIDSYQMEKRYLHADGHLVTILLSVSLVRDRKGSPSYFIAQIQDITERKESEAALAASLREKRALLKEVHHRVKNNLQVISSLLRIESGRSNEPGTRQVLREMQGRILSMALLHETLYRSGTFGRADLATYLKQLAEQLFRAQSGSADRVRLVLDMNPVAVGIDQAIPCGLIVNELLTNALKHAFAQGQEGEVRVGLNQDSSREVQLEVADTGIGVPEHFDLTLSKSLGLTLVNDLARQLGGRLEIGHGPGARFAVVFTPAALPQTTGQIQRPVD